MAAHKHATTLVAIVSFTAIFAASCGGGATKQAGSSTSASQASVDDLTTRVQRDEMLNAWVTVTNLPIHGLDTTLQGGKIDGKYVPTLRTLIRVLALTNWSSEAQAITTKMHDDAVALLTALDAGKDVNAVKDMSAALHDDSHGFGTIIGNVVARDLPKDAGGPVPTSPSTPMTGASPTPHP